MEIPAVIFVIVQALKNTFKTNSASTLIMVMIVWITLVSLNELANTPLTEVNLFKLILDGIVAGLTASWLYWASKVVSQNKEEVEIEDPTPTVYSDFIVERTSLSNVDER